MSDNETKQENTHIIEPDMPIYCHEDDRLGRAQFAEELAQSIR